MKRLINILAAGLLMVGMPCLAFEGEVEASRSVSAVSARLTADLSTGIKAVYCDVAVFYRMGPAPIATTSDMPRAANTLWYINITNDARRLAFITSGASGTCRIYPVNVLATSRAAGALIFGGSGGSSTTVTSGTVTLDGAGAGTATVTAGAVCVCSGAATLLVTGCSVAATTLTIQGNAGDTASYLCAA